MNYGILLFYLFGKKMIKMYIQCIESIYENRNISSFGIKVIDMMHSGLKSHTLAKKAIAAKNVS